MAEWLQVTDDRWKDGCGAAGAAGPGACWLRNPLILQHAGWRLLMESRLIENTPIQNWLPGNAVDLER